MYYRQFESLSRDILCPCCGEVPKSKDRRSPKFSLGKHAIGSPRGRNCTDAPLHAARREVVKPELCRQWTHSLYARWPNIRHLCFSAPCVPSTPHTPQTHTLKYTCRIFPTAPLPTITGARLRARVRIRARARTHARARAHIHKQPQPHSVYPIHTACAYRVTIPRANECHLPKLHEAWHTSTCAHDDAARFADEMRSRCDTC